jgi:hypothetical protein
MEQGKLMDVKLIKEGDNYFLNLTYQHEDDKAVYETVIYKAHLPINTHGFNYCEFDFGIHAKKERAIDIGFGELRLLMDEKGRMLITEVVEEKPKEMTIEEIEKALGHKVKIINKTEEDELPCCSECKYYHHTMDEEPCIDCKCIDSKRPYIYFEPVEE